MPVPQVMWTLLLKVEKPGLTTLHFVGCYPTPQAAAQQVGQKFGPLEPSGLGNYRMLEACGSTPPKNVLATQVLDLQSFVLAEY